ncbi:hypothetical protein BCV69DRAFT_71100 [Microstroma glucosiphilum]|uniref:SH3 domain-containing protein n=1 Tax=Pseudomicrostroma glucosiphilum TaxID=1684307 RepID=A0A316TYM0_9BASI|nr:hypothetical protein BCV69DRAFT_71100 [Pseudomicrostroma glucosiphilum]PWN18366.1 hypothetical protein BCV69DRAFT_71100 [Pseudomicrostroma glucosiphilum]
MDASTRHLVERMLADVHFLAQQGHIKVKDYQANTIRAQLDPILQSSASPAAASSQASTLRPSLAASSPSSSSSFQQKINSNTSSKADTLAATARNKVPPPPPPLQSGIQSPSTPAVAAEEMPTRDLVKALWTFDAAGGDDEMPFEVGDIIEVTDRSDADWWKGHVNGREGVFP